MSRARQWALVAPLAFSFGCTGLTLGENAPGEDTYLDDGRPPIVDDPDGVGDDTPYVGDGQGWCVFNGSIAVDPRTDVAYTAVSTAEVECEDWWEETPTEKSIFGVSYGGRPRPVMNVTGKDDVRILFPEDQILVMTEEDEHDTLTFLDPETYERIAELEQPVRYNGTRMSHSRRFVAVADNTSEMPDIHVIDTATQDIGVIPNGGDWLEAMWANTEDRLLAVIFYDMWTDAIGHARIVSWRPDSGGGFFRDTDERGLWQDTDLDIPLDGVDGDFFFSFTWVGISPDDRYAVFPMLEDLGTDAPQDHILVVVDLVEGTHRIVRDARGPVGFTPDGSTIVSYRYTDPDDPDAVEVGARSSELLLVDVDTLEETTVSLGNLNIGPQFFVTHADDVIVITSPVGSSSILLYDVDAGTTTSVDTPNGGPLYEFVSRDEASELWLVGDGLWRLDYEDAQYENVPLGFEPSHLNRLAGRDLLVLDDPRMARLAYFDPDLRSVVWAVDLPTPDR